MLFDDVCMRMTVSGDGAPRNRRVLGCGHPYSGAMRWEGLFADLEGQLAAEERRELDDEVAERTRRERALVTLADRLAGAVGSTVRLGLGAGLHVQGDIADLGDGWVLLRDPATGREHLVPTAAVVTVSALGARVETARAARRFGLGYALRALSRDRATVAISLSGVGASAGAGVSAGPGAGPGSGVGFGWSAAGGSVLVGTIDAVRADHLDLAEHPEGVPRRRGNVTAMTTVPFQALVLVESRR